MTTKTLTEADSGKTVEIAAGGTLVVSLNENPTTGYRWAVEALDEGVLKLQHDDYKAASGSAGASGMRTLTFQAAGKGTTALRLKMWREWEGDKSITKRFEATVRVM